MQKCPLIGLKFCQHVLRDPKQPKKPNLGRKNFLKILKNLRKIEIFKFLAGQKSTFPQVDRAQIFCGSYLGAKLPFEPKKSRVTGLVQNFVLPYGTTIARSLNLASDENSLSK